VDTDAYEHSETTTQVTVLATLYKVRIDTVVLRSISWRYYCLWMV